MPTFQITDFKSGLDLRRSYTTAPAGSLRTLRNCVISAGAEIEKRTMFIPYGAAPAGSFSVVSRNGAIYVIVLGPPAPSGSITEGTPGIITLPWPPPQRPDIPGLPPIIPPTVALVADWDLFNGQFYIVLRADNGHYYHYYNQVYVSEISATSSSIRTFGSKMYGVDGRLLRFSAINDPTKWTPPSGSTNDGSGYIDLSAQDADSESLIGLEVYLGNLAVFSSLSCQIWKVDPDPTLNQFVQLLRSTGLLAPQGTLQFGQDVLYVSSHGIRSLKVQNVSLTAGTTDIGTPIDELFRDLIIQNGAAWFTYARCLIQPRSARVFVVLPDRIYVLSTFQEPSITAWSVFDAPFGFVDACVADPWVAIRGDDNMIYLYGSDVTAQYDATEAEVITPALACDAPSKMKQFHSFDVGAEGTWTLSVGCDPNVQATEEQVATFTGSSYMQNTLTMPEVSTHISLRFRSTDPTRCRLGQVSLIFNDGSED